MKKFLYFNTKSVDPVTKVTAATKEHLSSSICCTVTETLSWNELHKYFSQGNIPDVMCCGISQIINSDPDNFLSPMHEIINTYIKDDKKINFCIPANNDLEYDHISLFKNLGFKGLMPLTAYHGVDATTKCISHLLGGGEYWPEFVIEHYKNLKTTPEVVIFSDAVDLSRELTVSAKWFISRYRENNSFKIKTVHSLDELTAALKKNPAALLFDSNMIMGAVNEFVSMLNSLVAIYHVKRKINIAAIVTEHTPLNLIKELQQTNTTGIVPCVNRWGGKETFLGVMNAINAVPHWPNHILKQLPGQNVKHSINNIELSFRQHQILNLIQTKGITNQQIAETLRIKEGTVKMHVGLLLKKYALQNRTQLSNL